MTPFRRFEWGSGEYSRAFGCLLRCSDERAALVPLLEAQLAALPSASVAVDWGAGSGDLTGLLARRCPKTFAVEPSLPMRAILRERLPAVTLLEGGLRSAAPPTPVDFALLAHVLYHLPDEEWPLLVGRLLEHLRPGGRLCVVMKSGPSGCRDMLERFGARGFDLEERLASVAAGAQDATARAVELSATIRSSRYQEVEQLARFMMCDRGEQEFASPPTEEEFADYVRSHFWDDARGVGGWAYRVCVWTLTRA